MTGKDPAVKAPTVRWGILGTGKIARIIATALSESASGKLAAVGSRDRTRVEAFAAEYGAERRPRRI